MANIDHHCGQKEIDILPAIDVRFWKPIARSAACPSFEPVGSIGRAAFRASSDVTDWKFL
jgi:hypothetical protein